jgi:hypothetical protein
MDNSYCQYCHHSSNNWENASRVMRHMNKILRKKDIVYKELNEVVKICQQTSKRIEDFEDKSTKLWNKYLKESLTGVEPDRESVELQEHRTDNIFCSRRYLDRNLDKLGILRAKFEKLRNKFFNKCDKHKKTALKELWETYEIEKDKNGKEKVTTIVIVGKFVTAKLWGIENIVDRGVADGFRYEDPPIKKPPPSSPTYPQPSSPAFVTPPEKDVNEMSTDFELTPEIQPLELEAGEFIIPLTQENPLDDEKFWESLNDNSELTTKTNKRKFGE